MVSDAYDQLASEGYLEVQPRSAPIVAAAAESGIRVRALSPLHFEPSPERGLLLGYGRLVEERVDEAVDALGAVLTAGGIRA